MGLVTDKAVGEHHDDPNPLGIKRLVQNHFDSFEHLSPAPTADPLGEVESARNVVRGCRDRFRKQFARPASKGDNLNRVARLAQSEKLPHRLLNLLRRRATHRTGHVDEKDNLARWRLGELLIDLWLDHEQKIALTGVLGMGQQGHLRLFPDDGVFHDEIFVRNRVGGREGCDGAGFIDPV